MAEVYDRIGIDYVRQRQPDPRWQATLNHVLGSAKTVVNIGAGTGSYEPDDRYVVAVEPSNMMIGQRPAGAAPVLRASAEKLPIADRQFDVAMALVTIHHWRDWSAGLHEMLRVANRIVVLHFDPVVHGAFWLVRDYLPEMKALWCEVPTPQEVAGVLGSAAAIKELLVPWDCVDGFLPAFWRRPDAYLEPVLQQSMSGIQLLDPDVVSRGVEELRSDLNDGTWRRRNAALLDSDVLDAGWRLIFT
ncbi:MAG: class I SAM-dependent methyltransferase [Acidimicrobiales bacterium]